MIRRIAAGIATIVLVLSTAGSVSATADVTNAQMREQGVTINLTNIPWMLSDDPVETPDGTYYFMSIKAAVGEASGHNISGTSMDETGVSYHQWAVSNDVWTFLPGWSGSVPNTAGLVMTRSLSGATLKTSNIPVGYCNSYETEDAGGGCTDYVNVGTVDLDLTVTPTSKLMTGVNTDTWGVPGVMQYTSRLTGTYRDVSVSGDVKLPGLDAASYSSPLGSIYRMAIGSMDLWVTHGPQH